MKWQWKIGTFAGIDVFVHATFLLIVGWYAFIYWQQTGTLLGALEGIAFILLLFAAVTLHEYGHALTARKFGVRTRDITLYPIGGVARLERMPDKPIQELWVALAGPAVNVVIAAVLFGWLIFTNSLMPLGDLTLATGSFIERLMLVNVFLVVFNLIPAFPMDGGRVLRAVLAMNIDYVKATQIAAAIGQGMAFLFGLAGLFGNPHAAVHRFLRVDGRIAGIQHGTDEERPGRHSRHARYVDRFPRPSRRVITCRGWCSWCWPVHSVISR